MTLTDPPEPKPSSAKEDSLDDMSEREFLDAWKAIVGEPPAIMLSSRAEMVRVLAESVPVATPGPADRAETDQQEAKSAKP
ncbi:hypothetical protein AFCDBAGC_5180 [Methylobacterium cerastii]|uniref:Anti-sigma factor NepR domain-containing protein n=1 Tax=Methylobacterium cerastii TaxID=932741 RepID=A0ABQ4QRP5_9HYPH|nr:hypothetical protein [Methylobacterium cerastii]GJD47287.1 hypothetical protein AFCDBAGC_5180 [Methylobacterium cerastii]